MLSFPLSEKTPLFRDNPPVKVWPQFSTDTGDVFNQSFLLTINHNGTHMDGPRHFNPDGLSLWELPIEDFIYDRVAVLDISKSDDELITAEDLRPHQEQIAKADLLIIRTGHGAFRSSDIYRYGWHNPGFAKSAGDFLIEFTNLKALGMDVPSAASAQNLDEGVAFHQAVLGTHRSDHRFILIIEDMNLEQDLNRMERVYALPLLVEGMDSGPCTIVGEFSE